MISHGHFEWRIIICGIIIEFWNPTPVNIFLDSIQIIYPENIQYLVFGTPAVNVDNKVKFPLSMKGKKHTAYTKTWYLPQLPMCKNILFIIGLKSKFNNNNFDRKTVTDQTVARLRVQCQTVFDSRWCKVRSLHFFGSKVTKIS